MLSAVLIALLPVGQEPRQPLPDPVVTQVPPGRPPATAPPTPPIELIGPDGEPMASDVREAVAKQLAKDPLPASRAPPPGAAPRTAGAGGDEVLVTGRRPRGSVIRDVPPIRTFSPLDIRAFGANDVGDLLQSLAPQVGSVQGREDRGPVVLLNGKRVSSAAEINKIPAEAIERVEVFPEELALAYGYRADQKVVNIVAFERFSSRVGRLNYAAPTEGGRDTVGGAVNYLRLRGDTRINVDADYARSGTLLESERGLLQARGVADAGRFRSLLPATEQLQLNATLAGEVIEGVSSSFNGRFDRTGNDSLLGPAGDGRALKRAVDTRLFHLGTTSNGAWGRWQWTLTANLDATVTDTATDRSGLAARDRARAENTLADADLVVVGSVMTLPAGAVTTSLRAGVATRDFTSRTRRDGDDRRVDLSRDRGAVQASVDIPIFGPRTESLAWLGKLSVNANVALEALSDRAGLRTFGYGLGWSPIAAIGIVASFADEQGAPTVEQLGAPLVVTPNVRTFDFIRGETVDVTRIFGGAPGLRSDDRHVGKIGLYVKPFAATDLNLSIEYVGTRIDDPNAILPVATPGIERAFPQRFVRDGVGRLLSIDATPVNFDRSEQRQVRLGFNLTRPLGPVPPGLANANVRFVGSEADLQRSLPPGARIIRPEAGSAAAQRFENVSSRVSISLYHNWRFRDDVLIRPGLPVLDYLGGAAVDGRGGRQRHEVELQMGAYKRGLGARVTSTWRSGTRVGDGVAGFDDLRFSSYGIVNLTLFANLSERLGGKDAPPLFRGMRIGFGINNLFDTRPMVRDSAGSTPLPYQSAYLDPLGRSANVSLRKIF